MLFWRCFFAREFCLTSNSIFIECIKYFILDLLSYSPSSLLTLLGIKLNSYSNLKVILGTFRIIILMYYQGQIKLLLNNSVHGHPIKTTEARIPGWPNFFTAKLSCFHYFFCTFRSMKPWNSSLLETRCIYFYKRDRLSRPRFQMVMNHP